MAVLSPLGGAALGDSRPGYARSYLVARAAARIEKPNHRRRGGPRNVLRVDQSRLVVAPLGVDHPHPNPAGAGIQRSAAGGGHHGSALPRWNYRFLCVESPGVVRTWIEQHIGPHWCTGILHVGDI